MLIPAATSTQFHVRREASGLLRSARQYDPLLHVIHNGKQFAVNERAPGAARARQCPAVASIE